MSSDSGSYTPETLLRRQQLAEALFKQSVEAEKGRDDALAKRFEEALREAKREPVTRPLRDFDLD